jgi:hypothetical protein
MEPLLTARAIEQLRDLATAHQPPVNLFNTSGLDRHQELEIDSSAVSVDTADEALDTPVETHTKHFLPFPSHLAPHGSHHVPAQPSVDEPRQQASLVSPPALGYSLSLDIALLFRQEW